ncbi:LysR family transcriptional regulator, partial [Pseudomonas aeruginosa]
VLARFIERVQAIESLESPRPMLGRNLDPPEEPAP